MHIPYSIFDCNFVGFDILGTPSLLKDSVSLYVPQFHGTKIFSGVESPCIYVLLLLLNE